MAIEYDKDPLNGSGIPSEIQEEPTRVYKWESSGQECRYKGRRSAVLSINKIKR